MPRNNERIIGCPCAIGGSAAPASIMGGTGKDAEQGLLFKNAGRLERAKARYDRSLGHDENALRLD